MMSQVPTIPPNAINHPDQIFEPCVECESRSYFFVELHSGGQLMYCLHHFNVHRDALMPHVKHLVDLSYLLDES